MHGRMHARLLAVLPLVLGCCPAPPPPPHHHSVPNPTHSLLFPGEYWDTLSYEWDGTPTHNQDAHRQRTVNWINAAGGLATAFDITLKGIMHAGAWRGCGLWCTWVVWWRWCVQAATPGYWLHADSGRGCSAQSKAAAVVVHVDAQDANSPLPPLNWPAPQCSSAASTGGCATPRASRRACWAGGPPAPSPSWRTTTRCAGWGCL